MKIVKLIGIFTYNYGNFGIYGILYNNNNKIKKLIYIHVIITLDYMYGYKWPNSMPDRQLRAIEFILKEFNVIFSSSHLNILLS